MNRPTAEGHGARAGQKHVVVFAFWTKSFRRRRIVTRPTPGGWPGILERKVWWWPSLGETQQKRLLGLIAIFLQEKEIVIPAEISDSETVRVTTAAAACQVLLGFNDWYCFDRIQTVILTLRPFRQQIEAAGPGRLTHEILATGVYSKGAPVTLCWPEVEHDCLARTEHRNVVVHEFAHHIDDLDGSLDGEPPFSSQRLTAEWRQAAEREMQRLSHQAASGQQTVLDPYGLASPVEFFAVACEAYFCNPHALAARHPELFQLLLTLFQLDPRPWFG